jgi:adenylosuccinate lyase
MKHQYRSPFSQRYGSPEMRRLWSEEAQRVAWRRVWLAVAEAQHAAGLVSAEELADLRQHARQIDLARARQIEARVHHDLMAELRTFAEQCSVGGRVLHWGLTSADVKDNADVLQQRAALSLLLRRLRELLLAFAQAIEETADLTVLGYTHLQPAEPITLGYRLALTAMELLESFRSLTALRRGLKGKGIKGAVGSYAPFVEMLRDQQMEAEALEARAMQALDLESYPLASQSYPRTQDLRLISSLALLAAALHKFAFDLRLMQSPALGEVAEPFASAQVGSSAMPFKRNPVRAEKICSLARSVAAGMQVAWANAANSLLERTLDDSANRRSLIPEAFLALDEMLLSAREIVEGLEIDRQAIARNLERYGPFAATERVLNALVAAGADRQAMHEVLRRHSLRAWQAVQEGKANPLPDLLASDPSLLQYLQPARVRALMDIGQYVGLAPQKARHMAQSLRAAFAQDDHEPQATS